jgi:dTMP kinase
MTAGRFIAFEGGEGSGKSTQARMLLDALEEAGLNCVLTREPGGTVGAEAIRDLLLDPSGPGWSMEAEALLFAAARSDHVARVIRPSLDSGKWVICDRFLESSRAYQGGEGRLTDADILELHRIGSGGLLPDLTILVEVDQSEASRRLRERDGVESDRIGGRPAEYHAGVAKRFESMAMAEPDRFARIPGKGTPDEVHARVLQAVVERMGMLA